MEQTAVVKIQIKVNPLEYQILHNTMKAYSDACNFVSEYIYTSHDLKRFHINQTLYNDLRTKYGMRSQMAQSVIITVIAKYKITLTNQKDWIKSVFHKPQLDLVWNRDYSFNKKKDIFSVNTLNGRVKCGFYTNGFEKYFNTDCKFGTSKLTFKKGKFYLHIPVTYEIDELSKDNVSNIVGIDRGIRFIATTYDNYRVNLCSTGCFQPPLCNATEVTPIKCKRLIPNYRAVTIPLALADG